jgi:hypothetical protein
MTQEAATKYYDTLMVIGAQNAILDDEEEEASTRHLHILLEAHQQASKIVEEAGLIELARIHDERIDSIQEEIEQYEV